MNEIPRRFARTESRAHEPALRTGASLRTLFLAEPALIRAGLPDGRSHLVALFLALFGAMAPLHAQIVRGQVVDSFTQVPLAQAGVTLADRYGAELARTLTDDEGRFLLRAPDAGEFHLRVEVAGYRSSTFPSFALAATEMKAFMLLIADLTAPRPVTAAEVIGEVCPAGTVDPGEGVLAGFVYDESLTPVVGANVVGSWPASYDAFSGLVDSVDLGRLRNVWSTDSGGTYVVCGIPPETEVVFHAASDLLLSDFHTLRFGDHGALVDGTLHPVEQPLVRHDFHLSSPAGRTAAISGGVVDADLTPLTGAVVEVVEVDLRTTTGGGGKFLLTGLPAGKVQITVRQVGFRAVTRDIQLTHGETVLLSPSPLILEAAPPELDPVVVEAERPYTRRPLSEFWERRERGMGAFLTREEWEKDGDPQVPTEVLRRMRGIRIVVCTGSNCPGRWLILTTRGQSRSGGNCFPLFFLDRLYIGDSGRVPIDDILPIVDLEAIEVYSSIAGLPPEFNRPGATCGVIVFWTR